MDFSICDSSRSGPLTCQTRGRLGWEVLRLNERDHKKSDEGAKGIKAFCTMKTIKLELHKPTLRRYLLRLH